jgi:hypothetical protein
VLILAIRDCFLKNSLNKYISKYPYDLVDSIPIPQNPRDICKEQQTDITIAENIITLIDFAKAKNKGRN